jgi:hypothetical protein
MFFIHFIQKDKIIASMSVRQYKLSVYVGFFGDIMAVLLPLITEQLGQELTLIVIHLLSQEDFRWSQHAYEI